MSAGDYQPLAGLPWWTLPVPTVAGRRTLDCLYPDDPHRVVVVPPGVIARLCHKCRTALRGHAWADPERETLLCARCHNRRHAGAPVRGAVDAPAPDEPDQLTIGDML